MKLIAEVPGIVKCSYNEEDKTTQHDWTTFLLMPDERKKLHEVAEVFLDFVKEHRVTRHIVNVKNCTSPLAQEDIDWLTNYFIPKEIEYGIKFLANVISDDIFTQLTSDEWQEKVENGLTVKNVPTVEEARLWLADKK